jgi:hypothetical protein
VAPFEDSPRVPQESKIPAFREDGYLPEGMYLASEAEVTFRFGTLNRKRSRLVHRVREWVQLCRKVKAPRLFIDGSFVTAKPEPADVDAVVLLPDDFDEQIAADSNAAVELEQMLLTRRPEEIFAAEDETDWGEWVEFFSRTREADGRRKGLVEVEL